MIRIREERKTLNEQCLWCIDAGREVYLGTIVNESASGLLLQTDEPLKLKDTLYLLTPCFGEPLTPDNLSAKQLIQYPVTRKGSVVRLASVNQFGIHFEEEIKPAEFRRWYRESSSVYTLLTKKVAVIALEGDINLETSTLTQSLVNNFRRQVSEFVFSLEQVRTFAGAAGAVIKSILKVCGSGGLTCTVIYNSQYDKAKQMVEEIDSNGLFSFLTTDVYNEHLMPSAKAAYSLHSRPKTEHQLADKHAEIIAAPEVRFLVVSSKITNQKRLSKYIAEKDGNVISVTYMHEALQKILEYKHHCVVVDVELEDTNLLLLFNQLLAKNLNHYPELIIIGPKHIDDIVKAALKLPVMAYLSKPYLDRDYHLAIEKIIIENKSS